MTLKIKRIILTFAVFAIIFSAFMTFGRKYVNAAEAYLSVTLSKSEVNVGDAFNVTVTYTSSVETGYLSYTLEYDDSTVKNKGTAGKIAETFLFESQTDNTKNVTKTYPFTANTVGTAKFTITNLKAYRLKPVEGKSDNIDASISAATVSVVNKGSSDATLKSLEVEGGTLVPKFSPDVTSYTVTVPFDVTELTIYPTVNEAHATHEIEGDEYLNVGTKTRTVIVTAQDGTVKKYAIKITRKPKPSAAPSTAKPTGKETATSEQTAYPTSADGSVVIDGKEYLINKIDKTVKIPEGYEKSKVKYQGQEYECLKGIGSGKILISLVPAESTDKKKTELYCADFEKNEFYPFVYISLSGKFYTVVPFENDGVFDAAKVVKVTVGAEEYDMMTTGAEGYYKIKATNWNGETGYYIFDAKEQTMQRWNDKIFSDASSSPAPTGSPVTPPTMPGKNPDNPDKTIRLITVGAVLVVIGLAVVLVIFTVKEAKTRKLMLDDSDNEKDSNSRDFDSEED